MVRRTYNLDGHGDAAQALGRKLVDVLVEANVTYAIALDALEAAADILADATKPVNV